MSFTVEYNDGIAPRSRRGGSDDTRTKSALLNAVVMGPQSVAYVQPGDTVVPDMWDVFAADNRTYMGTFTTAELRTATTPLRNRYSGHPWKPGQERRFGVPALHQPKKKRTRRGGRKSRAQQCAA